MQQTLQEHLSNLEKKIAGIEAALREPGRSKDEKMNLRLDLDLAARALAHFRRAFDLENRLFQ